MPARHDVGVQLGQVGAVDQDRAAGRPVELAQQLDQGGLAGAVLADDGDDAAAGRCALTSSRRAGRCPDSGS